jgi:hypothetical protein
MCELHLTIHMLLYVYVADPANAAAKYSVDFFDQPVRDFSSNTAREPGTVKKWTKRVSE